MAGSDPCLAAQLAELSMVTSSNQSTTAGAAAAAGGSYRASICGTSTEYYHERAARGGRQRSISICAVTPIDESSENGCVDPLGALIELKNNAKQTEGEKNIYCKNNRRQSLFELSG